MPATGPRPSYVLSFFPFFKQECVTVQNRRVATAAILPRRDGKHHLGMGDCQLRSGEGQTRHRYLVMLTHSLLMARRRQGRARDWAHTVLRTIGEACRAVSRETLSKTISWAVEQATTVGWTEERIVAYLKLVKKSEFAKVQF